MTKATPTCVSEITTPSQTAHDVGDGDFDYDYDADAGDYDDTDADGGLSDSHQRGGISSTATTTWVATGWTAWTVRRLFDRRLTITACDNARHVTA